MTQVKQYWFSVHYLLSISEAFSLWPRDCLWDMMEVGNEKLFGNWFFYFPTAMWIATVATVR